MFSNKLKHVRIVYFQKILTMLSRGFDIKERVAFNSSTCHKENLTFMQLKNQTFDFFVQGSPFNAKEVRMAADVWLLLLFCGVFYFSFR